MFSCAVRTPSEHMWRSNTKQRHNVEIMLIVPLFYIRHNSYFFSRYHCAKSIIKCPKIVKKQLIFDTFSPVYMGFVAYRAQYYLILSIAPPYIPSHSTTPPPSSLAMAADDGAACHNQQPTLPINVGIV